MPTKITLENAALNDAVSKASRIAPTKGASFDKAAGLLFIVDPAKSYVTIQSTDIDLTYEQRIPLLEGTGDAVKWRIPSSILQGIASNLPQADGAVVEFIDRNDPSVIRFKSGRMVAKLSTMDPTTFPKVESFDQEGMVAAQALANKVEQVAWATDPKSPLLSGIHVDGQRLIGCNQYTLAVVPCEVPLTEAVTVPLGSLNALLKNATDIKVRARDKRFEMMLDSETRASTALLAGQYPKVEMLMREDFTVRLKCHRQQFQDTLDRMMAIVQSEKAPSLRVEINGTGIVKMLTFDMDIQGTGRMQDSIDVQTDFDDIFSLHFVPRMLQEAVSKIRADYFTFDLGHPDPDKALKTPCRLQDGAGFVCFISTKVPST